MVYLEIIGKLAHNFSGNRPIIFVIIILYSLNDCKKRVYTKIAFIGPN